MSVTQGAADWYLVERQEDGVYQVWLADTPDDPTACGSNSIIVGAGLTRRAALAGAHAELLAQGARVFALAQEAGR